MKWHLSHALFLMALGNVASLATAEIPINFTTIAPEPLQKMAPADMPRLSPFSASDLSNQLVEQSIRERTLPTIYDDGGRLAAMRRISTDPVKRAHAVGHLAEEDFVDRNSAYRKTSSPIAPENDVWTYFQGELYGGQIKTHRSGDPAEYIRDMFKDRKAEYFLVPDDHFAAVGAKLRQQLERATANGNERVAAEWQQQLGRLKKLGRTYTEMDEALLKRATVVVTRSNALRACAAGALITSAVDGAVVVYRSAEGELTPSETVAGLSEAGAKGILVGGATTAAIVLGANPVGLTVFVVGGVTYIVIDYAISQASPSYQSSPMMRSQIESLMPEGWHLEKY